MSPEWSDAKKDEALKTLFFTFRNIYEPLFVTPDGRSASVSFFHFRAYLKVETRLGLPIFALNLTYETYELLDDKEIIVHMMCRFYTARKQNADNRQANFQGLRHGM